MSKKRTIVTISVNQLSKSWGPAVHYLELWNSFHSLFAYKYNIVGYCPYFNEKEKYIVDVKFSLIRLKMPKIKLVNIVFFDFLIMLKIIKHRKDIIYYRTGNFSVFIVFLLKILKVDLIVELNGIASDDAISSNKNKMYYKLAVWQEKQFIRNANGCIAVSDGIKQHALKNGAIQTITILNGISNSFFNILQKQKDNIIKIVYVGTFTSWDGAKYIKELSFKFPEIEFHMVGDGRLRSEIEKKCNTNVSFYGFQQYNQLQNLYSKFDAGIVLYDIERNKMKISSLKTLEYMASGLPIFTTDVPGQEFIKVNNIGICTSFEDLDSNFEKFIANISFYKGNVEKFRKEKGLEFSWYNVAKESKLFIEQTLRIE